MKDSRTKKILTFQHGNHAIAVHGLSGVELQLLEAPQNVLHNRVGVGLEDLHLVRVGFGELGD